MGCPSLAVRFRDKVLAESPHECWLWTGFISNSGYGRIGTYGEPMKVGYAHRVSWELLRGPIPEGFEVDHLCRNRWCVNPDHLEPVPPEENIRRAFAWRRDQRAHAGEDSL